MDSSQKSRLWGLHLSYYSVGHYPRFMTIGKDRNKADLKTDSFAVFESSHFVATE